MAVAFLAALGLPAYFGTASGWAGFTWPLVYAVIGYLLLSRPARPLLGLFGYVAAAIAIFVATIAVGYDRWPDFNSGPLVFVATFGLLWVVTAVPIGYALRPRILWLSSLTFGVYLAHPLVLDYVLLFLKPNSGTALALSFGLTLVGAMLLAAAWHRSRLLTGLLG